MTSKKEPFERIKSSRERLELFQSLSQLKLDLLCKAQEDSLFSFKINSVDPKEVRGRLVAIDKIPSQGGAAVMQVVLEQDRYFFNCELEISGNEASFKWDVPIYKLQRRSSFRIPIPESLEFSLNLIQLNGKAIFWEARVVDFSEGGIKCFLHDPDRQLSVADSLKLAVHAYHGKNLELEAVVRHAQKVAQYENIHLHYGIEFINVSASVKSKLVALSLDLQRRIVMP